MKKLLSLIVLTIIGIQFSCAGDVITKDMSKLPEQARTFLSSYFPEAQLQHIKIDKDGLSTNYEVNFMNGVQVDFDSKGNWTDVDTKKAGMPVPAALVPQFVTSYMQANNFTTETITKIEKDRNEIEVDLSSGISLYFTNDGKFKKAEK